MILARSQGQAFGLKLMLWLRMAFESDFRIRAVNHPQMAGQMVNGDGLGEARRRMTEKKWRAVCGGGSQAAGV
jgi:hypothetical protein